MTELVLIYDGDCPVCSSYVRYVRLKEAAGKLTLVNAREGGEWVNKVVAAGLSLDEGMALYYGGRFYHGVDCIHMLALLSTPSGVFNRVNGRIFSHPRLARALYPVLRAGRNSLLRILNRPQLHLTHTK
jgi:predicted DCC family thiol-disulfide oxidoreductase YuxK